MAVCLLRWWILIVITLLKFVDLKETKITTVQQAEVIGELKQYFRSRVVALVYSSDNRYSWSSQKMTMELTKNLISKNIFTITLSVNSSQQLMMSEPCSQLVVLLSAESKFLRNLFQNYVWNNTVWLTFLEDGQSVQKFMSDIYVRFDVQFLVAQSVGTEIQLFEVYYIPRNTTPYIERFGSHRGLLSAPAESYLYQRRKSLDGYVMKAASLNNPFMVWVNENNIIDGVFGTVWTYLEESLNFKSNVSIPPGLWGAKENNTWTGVVGMVHRGEAEVGVCDMAIIEERVGVIAYSMPMTTFHYKVFVRTGDADVSWNNVLKPFSTGLWIAVAASTLVMSLALTITYHVGILQGNEEQTGQKLKDWIFATFGALYCVQGQSSTPQSAQSRIAYLLSYLLGLVLLCAYSAALISFLTVRKTKLPFHNLTQLHADKSYKLGAVKYSSTLEEFKQSTEEPLRIVYQERLMDDIPNLPSTVLEGLQRVCKQRRFAFMAPIEETAEHVSDINCAIEYLPQGLFEMTYTMVFNLQSPFISIIRYNLQKMREGGVMDKIHQDTMKYQPRVVETTVKGVEMVDVVPVLCILMAGLILAIILVVLERLLSRKLPNDNFRRHSIDTHYHFHR